MATNWPSSVQTFTNPTSGSSLSSPSHADQHATVNDTVEALQTYAGLVLVKTQTIGSGVSSVTVTNAFSSTFDNYIITKTGGTASVNSAYHFYLTGSTSNYKWTLNYSNYATSGLWISGNTTSEWRYVGSSGTTQYGIVIPINQPFLTTPTSIGPVAYSDNGATGTMTGWHASSTSHTGFVFSPSAGTFSGGTIRVYGYNNGA